MRRIEDLQTQKYKAEFGIVISHLFIFGGIILAVPGVMRHWSFFIVTGIFLIIGIAARQVSKNNTVHIEKALLYDCFKPSVEQHFADLRVMPSQGIDALFFENNKLIKTGNYYKSRQKIEGKLANTRFKAAYVSSEHVTKGSIKRYTTHTYFDGKVLDFELNGLFKYRFAVVKLYNRNETEARKDYVPFSLNNNYVIDYVDQDVASSLISDSFTEALENLIKSIDAPITLHFYQHHCTLLIEDGLPFVDTKGGKTLSDDHLLEVNQLLRHVEDFVTTIKNDTLLWQ